MPKSRKKRKGPGVRQVRPSVEERNLRDIKRAYYSGFDYETFKQRRARYFGLDFSDPTFDAVSEVRHVLMRDGSGREVFPFSWNAWCPGAISLWRARGVSREKALFGYHTSDLWEPPAGKASTGRFNSAGESLLYACIGDPWVALREARVTSPGDAFILVKYGLIRSDLLVRRVGLSNEDPGLSLRERMIEAAITKFVGDAIRAPAVDRGEDTYRFTRNLLREFYPLEGSPEIGWLYESVQSHGAWNVALPPGAAHDLLQPRGVIVGRSESPTRRGSPRATFVDWTDDCAEVLDGRIGFPTFKAPIPNGMSPMDLLPD